MGWQWGSKILINKSALAFFKTPPIYLSVRSDKSKHKLGKSAVCSWFNAGTTLTRSGNDRLSSFREMREVHDACNIVRTPTILPGFWFLFVKNKEEVLQWNTARCIISYCYHRTYVMFTWWEKRKAYPALHREIPISKTKNMRLIIIIIIIIIIKHVKNNFRQN